MGQLRWCLVALLALSGAVDARQTPRLPLFHSNVALTTVTVTVLDKNGALVGGLPREAFDVFEDSRPQPVAQFTNERVPVSLAVLLDISDSMYGQRINDAREAVESFITKLLDPADEFAIVAFNHRQRLLTAWTDERDVAASVM